MKRRILTVVLALVLAVIGTIGVFLYVGRADARALAGQQAVTVLIAALPIPGGTTAAEAQAAGMLTSRSLPAAAVTADTVESITPELGELVTSADIPVGQVLLRPMLVSVEESPDELAIPDGMVAVSLQFCAQQGVAGFVRVGSLITITDTVVREADIDARAGCEGPHQQQTGQGAFTAVVLPNVEVLAVGPAPNQALEADPTVAVDAAAAEEEAAAADEAMDNPVRQDGLLLTVAVTLPDAQRLIVLTQTGLPYLVLLPGSAP